VVVAGLGGIGSILATYLVLFLASLKDHRIRLLLVDGDSFEERNRERMEVAELGNKADVLCGVLGEKFGRPGLIIRPVDRYISKENAGELLLEKDLIFACLDNHATRKILSQRCEELENVVLISGGNDGVEGKLRGTYGNVQVLVRENGSSRTAPLTRFHPEILHPADKPPTESCMELSSGSAPQILFTNLAAASAMCNALYRLLRADPKEPLYDEVCFDILEARMVPQLFSGQGSPRNGVQKQARKKIASG